MPPYEDSPYMSKHRARTYSLSTLKLSDLGPLEPKNSKHYYLDLAP
jgi:hypothetical protein